LRWDCITPDLITLPPEITKNNTQHVLPNLISNYLELIPKTNGYLFPSSTGGTPFSAWSKSKTALDALSGVSGYVLHDLRRTFSTNHARIGTSPHVTEAILNHKTGVRSPLQRIYDRHTYLPEMRQALANHDAFLRAILKNE
jgi:integrase